MPAFNELGNLTLSKHGQESIVMLFTILMGFVVAEDMDFKYHVKVISQNPELARAHMSHGYHSSGDRNNGWMKECSVYSARCKRELTRCQR